jgi:hypothetical protein
MPEPGREVYPANVCQINVSPLIRTFIKNKPEAVSYFIEGYAKPDQNTNKTTLCKQFGAG